MKIATRVFCTVLAVMMIFGLMAFGASAAESSGYTPSADGSYVGIPAECASTKQSLSYLTYLDSSNTSNTTYPQGQPTTVDTPYGKPDELILIGEQDTIFFEGLGMHPRDPSAPINGSIESYTIYDISTMRCNRFYAAVGITNSNGRAGKSQGVIYRVYGDYEGFGEYKLLAESDVVSLKGSGEFDVDIEGVKLLKLVVVCPGNSHASSGCAWADASLYATEEYLARAPEIEPTVPEPTQPQTEPTEPVEKPPKETSRKMNVTLIYVIEAVAAVAVGTGVGFVLRRKKK